MSLVALWWWVLESQDLVCMCCYNAQHSAVFASRSAVLILTEGLIWCPESIFFILYNGCILLVSLWKRFICVHTHTHTHTHTCTHTTCAWECSFLPNSSPQAPLSLGILRAKILEWVVIPSSRASSQPRDRTQVSLAGRFFTIWATGEALILPVWYLLGQHVVSLSLTLWAENVCPQWYLYYFACTFSNNYFYFFFILIIFICKIQSHCAEGLWGFPGGSVVENLSASAGDMNLVPGLGISPEVGNGNPP